MTPLPLVSVCVPTYNRPEYLRRAVESCLKQTWSQFEIVITDNSTNQDTADMAAKWSDPRIRYSPNDGNIGACGSSNRAVSLSTGKYIKFLMDDDLLKPRCLELMVKALEENPSAAIAMAPMELIDKNDRRIFPRFYVFQKMHYRYRYQAGDGLINRRRLLKDFLTNDYPCTVPSGIMFRTEAKSRAGKFAEEAGFAGDLEMCMRLAADWDFYYIDEVLSSWRYEPSSETVTYHNEGLPIKLFYDITHKSLANESVKKMFAGEWGKIERDSLLFCSSRAAVINGLAGVRSRNLQLIYSTIKTIVREDKYVYNWFRLPFFLLRKIFAALFPRHNPPAREQTQVVGS